MFIWSAFDLFAHMRDMENGNSIKIEIQTETRLSECFPSWERIDFKGNKK